MANLYCWSGAVGSGSGADWTNAKTNLTAAFTTEVAGDTIFVAHDHNESTAGSVTLTSSGTISNVTKIICVNRAGSVPPVSADRRTTAQVACSGTTAMSFRGYAHYDGIIFNGGVGGTGGSPFSISDQNGMVTRFDNCSLRIKGTGSTGGILIGSSTSTGIGVAFENTTVEFSHVGQSFIMYGSFIWRNTASALIGGVIPSIVFSITARANVECIGVDLSAAGSGKSIVGGGSGFAGTLRLTDCKLDAAVTKSGAPTTHGGFDVDFVRCGASGNYAVYRIRANRHTDGRNHHCPHGWC